MLNKNGTVRGIYCHFDGHQVGRTLSENYTKRDKIDQLLDLGDLSVLGKEIGEKQDFDNFPVSNEKRNWCLAYGRDRDESDIDARIFKNEEEFLDKCKEDFTYLFKDEKWYYRRWNEKLKVFK